MKHTFHPPNRMPDSHPFILFLSDVPFCREAAKLIHEHDPGICVATLAELPPINANKPGTFAAWMDYHLHSAWRNGVIVFWRDEIGGWPGTNWLDNLLWQTLAEYRRLIHTQNQIRLAIGFDIRLHQCAAAFQRRYPEFPIYGSLSDACWAATNMLNHNYRDPRLAAIR